MSEQLALDLAGRRLRDRGLRLVELATYRDPWLKQAERALRALASSGAEFTAETLREMCGDPPRPNTLGALFLQAHKAGLIEPAGWAQAERPQRRACALRVWRGAP